jgi:hypothetical protein
MSHAVRRVLALALLTAVAAAAIPATAEPVPSHLRCGCYSQGMVYPIDDTPRTTSSQAAVWSVRIGRGRTSGALLANTM